MCQRAFWTLTQSISKFKKIAKADLIKLYDVVINLFETNLDYFNYDLNENFIDEFFWSINYFYESCDELAKRIYHHKEVREILIKRIIQIAGKRDHKS